MQSTPEAPAGGLPALRAGDRVEVRSAEEILATLDAHGELESLPFMPEMQRLCGRRFTVGAVAHKLCDTISGTGFRRMDNAVHLTGVRCDGAGHGGCQAACLIYWKTAWLRRVEPGEPEPAGPEPAAAPAGTRLLPLLSAATRGEPEADGTRPYRCQATSLLRAAPQPLPVRNLGQYARDVRSGNVGPLWALRAFVVSGYDRVQQVSRGRLPRWLRWRGGRRWNAVRGSARPTPTAKTDLLPGELVRIRSKAEIAATLDPESRNRGLGFDTEMARFCGRTARVARRVEQIIDEKTGRMLHMKYPCIVLEGIVCEGAYSLNCPRAIPAYWREIWLERLPDGAGRVAG